MMKATIEKLLTTKREQRDNLNKSMIESDTREERAAIGETLSALAQEIADLEALLAEADEPAAEEAPAEGRMTVLGAMTQRTETTDTKEEITMDQKETRAAAFAEKGRMVIDNTEARAVLVSSGSIATPTEVSGIHDIIGARVSSIVDMVKVVNAGGMGAYKVAFQITDAEAAAQTEGETYQTSDATFGLVTITPETKAILSYISKQTQKQTPLNYQAKVEESALIALRKAAAKLVTEKIVASPLSTALSVTAIGADTLRKIAFSYGGDESIEGGATLFLNKKDLIKFGDARGQNEKKAVYEITPDASNPNTGIIKDGGLTVPYCIDSNLTEGTLVYGAAHACELALFSDYEIKVSEDFAFDKGMLAVRGDVELGADVVKQGGFVKVTVG